MIYEAGTKRLLPVRKVLTGAVNDVWVCRDDADPGKPYYTLLTVRDHNTARLCLEIMDEGEQAGRRLEAETFTAHGAFCICLPSAAERSLEHFYMGSAYTLEECAAICANVVTECIASTMPWQFLYLVLEQKQLQLSRDGSISFGCQWDLSHLSKSRGERDCAVACALLILGLMDENPPSLRAVSRRLLQKKIPREGYDSFPELYKDVRLTSEIAKKESWKTRLLAFWREKKGKVFHLLAVLSIFLGIAALLMFLSQMVFGDIPFLRLFVNSFREIGTESLVK